jgi:hypothetical protein
VAFSVSCGNETAARPEHTRCMETAGRTSPLENALSQTTHIDACDITRTGRQFHLISSCSCGFPERTSLAPKASGILSGPRPSWRSGKAHHPDSPGGSRTNTGTPDADRQRQTTRPLAYPATRRCTYADETQPGHRQMMIARFLRSSFFRRHHRNRCRMFS